MADRPRCYDSTFARLTLSPHAEYEPLEMRNRAPLARILGDSLLEGTYQIVLVRGLGEARTEVLAGTVALKRPPGRTSAARDRETSRKKADDASPRRAAPQANRGGAAREH